MNGIIGRAPHGLVIGLTIWLVTCNRLEGQTQPTPSTDAPQQEGGELPDHFRKFEQQMRDVELVGHFTVLGQDQDRLREERYTIFKVEKLPRGDYWLFHSHLRYGNVDVNVPIPLEVKWAGDTPVITLTNLTIPGLGTFSARVVIDQQQYAGTWTHGEARGHLFGIIRQREDRGPSEPSP